MVAWRYRRILFFFARMLISLIVWELALPRLGLRRWVVRTRPKRLRHWARKFRSLAVQMGGVLIKVGQFLSSRVDILPAEITDELQELQDEVPPAPFDEVRCLAEDELGAPLEQIFPRFDPVPLAAASLGQVHRAYLPSATPTPPVWPVVDSNEEQPYNVVVKILRPNIEQWIATDLAALRTVGRWLHRYPPIRRRANIPLLLEEFSRVIYEEVDYYSEGRNAETFAAHFRYENGVRVPRVYWTHTTRRVLTLENVFAIKITDYAAIEAAGVRRSEVASRLLKTYLKQIFEDGFFHADPHPGNLFVRPLTPLRGDHDENTPWELTFVDFGMVGRLPPALRQGLRELVIGVGMRDTQRVIRAYQMMDILLPGADLALIERAEERLFERFWGKTMSELTAISLQEMHELAREFRELLFQLPFQVPQNLIYLVRCVGILSGMCTGLDPQFNLWNHLTPYAQKLIAEQGREQVGSCLAEAERLARTFVHLPQKVDLVLTRLERGETAVRVPELSEQLQSLRSTVNRLVLSVVFSAFFLGGISFFLAGEQTVAAALWLVAGLILLRLGWQSRRSG